MLEVCPYQPDGMPASDALGLQRIFHFAEPESAFSGRIAGDQNFGTMDRHDKSQGTQDHGATT